MTRDFFTTAEVAQITGFTIRQLDYWARQGIVVPSMQQAPGSGNRRLYSIDDLIKFQFIRQLKKHGWSTQKIREAIKKLQDVMNDPNPLKSAMLIGSKDRILALSKTKEGERILLDALSDGGQYVNSIVLESFLEETNQVTKDFSQLDTFDEPTLTKQRK